MPSPQSKLDTLVSLYSALGDGTRLSVLELLANKPRPVHDLAAAFDISRPAISRHLKVLKDAGLVVEEKRGRENVYALVRVQLQPMADWLTAHLSERVQVKAAAKTKGVTGGAAPRAKAAARPVPTSAEKQGPVEKKSKPQKPAKPATPEVPKLKAPEQPVTPPPQMGFDF